MLHKDRAWSVELHETAESLVSRILNHDWCGCVGFRWDRVVLLNDGFVGGINEFALVLLDEGAETAGQQLDTITVPWCSSEKLLGYLRRAAAGEWSTDLGFGRVVWRLHGSESCYCCA